MCVYAFTYIDTCISYFQNLLAHISSASKIRACAPTHQRVRINASTPAYQHINACAPTHQRAHQHINVRTNTSTHLRYTTSEHVHVFRERKKKSLQLTENFHPPHLLKTAHQTSVVAALSSLSISSPSACLPLRSHLPPPPL